MARPRANPPLPARVGLCLTEQQRLAIERLAEVNGQGISETIRRLIEQEAQRRLITAGQGACDD